MSRRGGVSIRSAGVIGFWIIALATVAACGEVRAATTKQRSLAALVLRRSEAPGGTRYMPQMSGPGALARQGASSRTIAELERFGFRSDYARQFYGTNPHAGIRGITSSVAEFRNPDGASKALHFLRNILREQHPEVGPVPVAGLGEEAWGYGGRFFREAPPTFTAFYYAWRSRDLVLSVAIAGSKRVVTQRTARLLADKVANRTRGAGGR